MIWYFITDITDSNASSLFIREAQFSLTYRDGIKTLCMNNKPVAIHSDGNIKLSKNCPKVILKLMAEITSLPLQYFIHKRALNEI